MQFEYLNGWTVNGSCTFGDDLLNKFRVIGNSMANMFWILYYPLSYRSANCTLVFKHVMSVFIFRLVPTSLQSLLLCSLRMVIKKLQLVYNTTQENTYWSQMKLMFEFILFQLRKIGNLVSVMPQADYKVYCWNLTRGRILCATCTATNVWTKLVIYITSRINPQHLTLLPWTRLQHVAEVLTSWTIMCGPVDSSSR